MVLFLALYILASARASSGWETAYQLNTWLFPSRWRHGAAGADVSIEEQKGNSPKDVQEFRHHQPPLVTLETAAPMDHGLDRPQSRTRLQPRRCLRWFLQVISLRFALLFELPSCRSPPVTDSQWSCVGDSGSGPAVLWSRAVFCASSRVCSRAFCNSPPGSALGLASGSAMFFSWGGVPARETICQQSPGVLG